MPHKDPDRRNEKARARYAANPEKFRARTRAQNAKHSEKRKAYAKAYGHANRAKLAAKDRQRWNTDPEFRARKHEAAKRYRARYREREVKRNKDRYGLNHEIVAGRPRPDNCDICGGTKKIVFDHCHQKGHFRGWLCQPCNVALGMVHDDEQHLLKLIAYLRRNREHTPPQLVIPGI